MNWALVSFIGRIFAVVGVIWTIAQENMPRWVAGALGCAVAQLVYDVVLLYDRTCDLEKARAERDAATEAGILVVRQACEAGLEAQKEAAHYRRLYLQKVNEQ